MGLFDFFFKKPAKITDPVFGELLVEKHFLANEDFFFAPANASICLIIDSTKEASEEQRVFYRTVEQTYPELKQKVRPLLVDHFRNWKEDFEIKDFDREFTLSSIGIPDMSIKPVVWEMSFSSIHDDNHELTATFHDFEPEPEIGMNG